MKRIINVAVIAHVDAGKSTLVDALLEQSGTFGERDERIEQIMDSDDLERERGITIYSKNCSIDYKGDKNKCCWYSWTCRFFRWSWKNY